MTVVLCEIVLAYCRCGTTFPALPGVDRTGRCAACRHRYEQTRRVDKTSPGYRLAANVATYSAALHLISVIGERMLTRESARRGELMMALQEIVEVAGAAVFGAAPRDASVLPAGLVPRQRPARSAVRASEEIA